MNKATIRKQVDAVIEAANAALDSKGEKERPTEKDEEIMAALEDFIGAVESAIDDLGSAYDS